MSIEIFKTDDGMLTVEKSNDPAPNIMKGFAFRAAEPEQDGKEIRKSDLIETAFTYQTKQYAVCVGNGKGKCEICGAETDYSNRHVCPYCWGQNEGKILQALKDENSGEVVRV